MDMINRRRMLILNGKHSFIIFEANKVPLDSRYISGQGEYTVATDKIIVGGGYDRTVPRLLIKGTITPKFSEYKTIHILAKATVQTYQGLKDGQMRVDNQTQLVHSPMLGTPYIIVSGKTEREYILDISPTAKSFQFKAMQTTSDNTWSTGEITKIWLEK